MHLNIACHITTSIPYPSKELLLRSIAEIVHESSLENIMLLQLFSTGIHDLEVAIEICMLGHLYPIENHPLQAIYKGIHIDCITHLPPFPLLCFGYELLLNYLESIHNRLL